MKKVLVFGTFDGIHEGHLDFFRQAKQYGDYLIVVAALDKNIHKIKKHLPKRSERERLNDLQKCKIVDKAVIGYEDDPYRIIKEMKPEVICLGYDQHSEFSKHLEKFLRQIGSEPKIVRLKPYKQKNA